MNKQNINQQPYIQAFTWVLISIVFMFFSSATYAAEEKGSASLDYGFSLSDKEKQQVLEEAKKNAL